MVRRKTKAGDRRPDRDRDTDGACGAKKKEIDMICMTAISIRAGTRPRKLGPLLCVAQRVPRVDGWLDGWMDGTGTGVRWAVQLRLVNNTYDCG